MLFTLPENALNLCIFTHAPDPYLKFLIFCFQDGRGRGSYDLLYQNSIRKYENDLGH